MVPETGRRFGPYEILDRLGGGGMGHVFKAWDARLHREVAVKFLQNEYAMPGMRERFLREARAASALNHPNICTVFDIGEQDGDPYLVMELLQGETLKDRIDRRNVSVEDMVCVGKEVAEALGAAHAKGVIHRDIKPANIFLVSKANGGFQSKVLDFGLAKIEGGVLGARGSRSMDITTAGSTVGTLAYMSPEQARGEVLDSRSDLFSLGVVLYEMATRQIPFPGATSALVFVKLLNHAPEPVRDWNESVPRDLEKIVMKLMSKERTARFQTSHELFEALSKIGEKPTGWLRKAVSTSTPAQKSQESLVRERRRDTRDNKEKRKDSGDDLQLAKLNEPPAYPSPRPSNDAPQFLRPVARVPRPDNTPKPLSDLGAAGTKSEAGGEATVAGVATAVAPANATTPREMSSGEFTAALVQEPEQPRKVVFRIRPLWIVAALVLLAVLLIAGIFIVNRGHFGPTMLTEQDSVVLTQIENRTGDKVLDGTVTDALQIALAQSPYLLLRRSDAYRIARRQVEPITGPDAGQASSRSIAQKLGAKAFFYGTISNTTAPYTLHVNLINTATNDLMSSVEERIPSVQEIPAAIDRASDGLRANVGEDSDSISRSHNSLSREATSNMEALHDFSLAEDAFYGGRTLDALRLYQQAVALEPRFVLAQLRLAVLYRKQRAEVAAAEAARLALAASDNTSDRTHTFAQYEYEMNSSGDYVRASGIIRHLVALNSHDSEALEALSRSLRLQGRMAEALQTAQQAYAADPLNVDAYTQADNALIGLDRYDAAFQLQGTEQRLGIARAGGALTSAYLEGRQETLDAAIASFEGHKEGFRPDWSYGLYLDNIGQLTAANQHWHRGAAASQQIKGLESAGAFLLAQGAIDHALIGDCAGGLALARESAALQQGITTRFNNGMAAALCGDTTAAKQEIEALQKQYPQSFSVNGFYVADIQAAMALQANDPAAALEVLKPARQYDLISLTPYLRGRAHVALRQGQIGIVDYQTVLAHRGVTFIVGSDVYPIAEIGVARAFADTGDLNNSADAYKRFLELWKTADPNQPLVAEAKAHTRTVVE